jgi:hypothetical protein
VREFPCFASKATQLPALPCRILTIQGCSLPAQFEWPRVDRRGYRATHNGKASGSKVVSVRFIVFEEGDGVDVARGRHESQGDRDEGAGAGGVMGLEAKSHLVET